MSRRQAWQGCAELAWDSSFLHIREAEARGISKFLLGGTSDVCAAAPRQGRVWLAAAWPQERRGAGPRSELCRCPPGAVRGGGGGRWPPMCSMAPGGRLAPCAQPLWLGLSGAGWVWLGSVPDPLGCLGKPAQVQGKLPPPRLSASTKPWSRPSSTGGVRAQGAGSCSGVFHFTEWGRPAKATPPCSRTTVKGPECEAPAKHTGRETSPQAQWEPPWGRVRPSRPTSLSR